MQNENGRLSLYLQHWVGAVQRHALWIVLLAALTGVALAGYTSRHLSVDTDNQNMLSATLSWRKAEDALERRFPTGHQMVVVVDGDSPELANDAMRRLLQGLRMRPDLFSGIFAPEADPFFRRNGLLYLDPKALQQTADNLMLAQPFLGALGRDPSVHGLFTLLDRAVGNDAAQGFDLAPALGKIADGVNATANGRFYQLSWQQLMSAPVPDANRRFIQVAAHMDFSKLLPAAAPMAGVHELIRTLHLDAAHGVHARVTGTVALEHEELQTVVKGMGLALAAAMIMAVVLLYLALRSLRLMAATVITLVFGLLATAAFAAAAIGHLNMISVAFGVLYVGLGLDYGLYLCMQYREFLGQGVAPRDALPRATGEVGGFMLVCAATTSLAFFAFIPTAFTGISELGVISGAGMFISLILSLTLLPALISLMPPNPDRVQLHSASSGLLGRVLSWPYTYARTIWLVSAALALGALLLAPKARFDYDPLDLRDPASESVSTFRDLLKDPNIPTLTLSVLAPNANAAQQLAHKLSALPLVARAMTLLDFIPQDQTQKLSTIGDLALALGPDITQPAAAGPTGSPAADREAFGQLRNSLPDFIAHASGADTQAAKNLLKALDHFSAIWQQDDATARVDLMARLNLALTGAMPAHLDDLRIALQAQPVSESALPSSLVARWRSSDGEYRVEVWPKEVLDNPAAMGRFIAQVRTVAPDAIGPPVSEMEAGKTVVSAFRQAFISSFIAITLLLLILLRSAVDTLLVLIPLALAGLLTMAGMVLLNIPFNFANVIALPLILGVGVDYGVYIVQRGRQAAAANINILHTGTARAVLFGALITMANFGNLMLAKHPGTVSMGLLLTVGLGMTLLCALVLLPSLLARRYGNRRG
ncbi:MAG: MMPL family transporter [Stenotrophobium sp.]